MSVNLLEKNFYNTVSEVKAENQALKNSITYIVHALFTDKDDYYQRGLKPVVVALYPINTTRCFYKVNKYLNKADLPSDTKRDIYTSTRLLAAFSSYKEKNELPVEEDHFVALIILITRKIQTVFDHLPFPEVVDPTLANEIPYPVTILANKGLALLPVERTCFKQIKTKFKEIFPVIAVHVPENPECTPCSASAFVKVVPKDDGIMAVMKEIAFFRKLQEKGQVRGIIETTDFSLRASSGKMKPHYIQPRGTVLHECIQEKCIQKQLPKLFLDIAYGLRAMHKQSLAHLDVKFENIVVLNKEPMKAKLIDLGLTSPFNLEILHYGTLIYTPVDIFEKKYALADMDLFAFGLVIYASLHCEAFPWAKNLELAIKNISREENMALVKDLYTATLEKEIELYTSNHFQELHELHGLSIDLLRTDKECTIDDVIERLESMQGI